MNHRHSIVLGKAGDYIILESQEWRYIKGRSRLEWVEHTRWLIPGTQLED